MVNARSSWSGDVTLGCYRGDSHGVVPPKMQPRLSWLPVVCGYARCEELRGPAYLGTSPGGYYCGASSLAPGRYKGTLRGYRSRGLLPTACFTLCGEKRHTTFCQVVEASGESIACLLPNDTA